MEPQISVVIPIYKCEDFVERAVHSVLSQPCAEKIEILLVDDGSPDKCGEICDRLAAEHANIRVFHKENGGVSSARNLGIEKASGKYLAFLDADDWWEKDFFDNEMVAEFSRPEMIDVYVFSYKKINFDYTYEHIIPVQEKELIRSTPFYSPECFVGIHPCCYIHRKNHIIENNIRYLSTKLYEDIPFAEMSTFFAKSEKSINKPLFNYWENFNSCVHTTSTLTSFEETCKALKEEQDFFEKRGFAFDSNRIKLSMIVSYLPDWCAFNSFSFVRNYLKNEYCRVLTDPSIQPWSSLMSQYDMWKKHPRIFWLKSRISPGIPYKIKKITYAISFLRKPVNHFFHRFILKWKKVKRTK